MEVEILEKGYKVLDSGFYIVKEDTGQYFVHVSSWQTLEQAMEEAKKLARASTTGQYIVVRNKNGSGEIYRALEKAY